MTALFDELITVLMGVFLLQILRNARGTANQVTILVLTSS